MIQLQQSASSQQSQSVVEVGLARFKPGAFRTVQHLIAPNFIKDLLTKSNWRLKTKPFIRNWHPFFSQLEQALCERMFIQATECSSVLTSIVPCWFPHLTVLNISHNPINNLEPLAFLHAPNLQFLFLQTNDINSVKTLAKIYFSNLEDLDVSNNKLQQISEISRLKTMKGVKGFSVELFTFDESHHHHWHQDDHNCRVETINMMAKLEHEVDYQSQDAGKKYEMLKRQFEYALTQVSSSHEFTDRLRQKRVLKAFERKYCW